MALAMKMSCFRLLALSVLFAGIYGQTYTLSVVEEKPKGTLVGSIQNDPQFVKSLASVNRTALKFMFFGQRNPWINSFRMEEVSGIIYTTEILDREIICPDLPSECFQDFDVAVHSDAIFKILKLKIVIEDINDNAPEFPKAEVTVNIPESAPIGFKVPIRGATDKDTGKSHGVEKYEIFPADGQFTVSVIENLDGSPEVGIVVGRTLDRELMSSHSVEILAKDGGVPPRTGTVKVTILVTDANDHSPTFSRTVYNISVLENLPVNTSIIQVKATDRDTGVNGKISYRFSTRTAAKFSDVFQINTASGEIRVVGVVDYETEQQYRLVVEAADMGVQPRTAQALVLVNLTDTNDNTPSLKYNFLPRGDHAIISENANINDFVAHISALDRDNGQNAEVNCTIGNPEFKLERLYDNEFQVNLGVKLNRETISEYNVTILCNDRGKPSLTVAGHFLVIVADENDNSPEFKLSSYVITLKENTSVGEGVLHLNATDDDIGKNGKVSYELYGNDSSFFKIDNVSGMLSLRQKLDYENTSEISFTVMASDAGIPPRHTNATVAVMIVDVNDERPKFNQTFYRFSVLENSPLGTVIGSVVASDPDLGLGGKVSYTISDTPESTGMFAVSSEDGLITTAKNIDREKSPMVRFFVVATDKGDNPLTSTVGVAVEILDVNDNSPMVQLPYVANSSVIVYSNQPPQTPFVKLVAEDPDAGENGTLTFAIEAGDPKSLFGMNAQSGEIFLRLNSSSKDSIISQESASLLVSVKDHGSPQRVTLKRFNVTVLPTNVSGSVTPVSDGLPNNFIIVIAVICATTFLSVIIIITIFIIRRQNRRDPSAGFTGKTQPDKAKVNVNVDGKSGTHSTNPNQTNGKTKKGVNFVFQNEQGLLSGESTTDPPSKMAGNKQRPSHDVVRQPASLTGDDETSNVSGETVTSDSGRGGSEEDAHSRRHYPMDEQECLTKNSSDCGLEGEYVDMQRSPLSYMASLRNHNDMNRKLPEHYYNILRRTPRLCDNGNNVVSRPGNSAEHDHQGYTRMSPVSSEARSGSASPPPPIPRRQQLSLRASHGVNKRALLSDPVIKIDVGQICRSQRRQDITSSHDSLVNRSDVTGTTFDDDSATTTSGSYSIDDLSECESQEAQTASV
ncbi:protocadherin-11 X-linked-like [Liolophura sinensis]|uniref:protocadherin-11 X-linked-like n=1 Tax=Liolophura sinensis TaxID=3198878 RepID=UPI003157FB5E